MPPTTTPEDRQMIARLGRAYANPDNAEWAEAYFDKTHAGHSNPADRTRHEKHVAAVQQLQNDIAADHAAARARETTWQPVDTQASIEREIRSAMAEKAYGDTGHKDHARQVEYVGALYRKLHPGT